MHTLKCAAKLLHIFPRRASRGAAWPLHFKFASYAYVFTPACSSKEVYIPLMMTGWLHFRDDYGFVSSPFTVGWIFVCYLQEEG